MPEGPVFDAANIRRLLDSETYQVRTLLYALFADTLEHLCRIAYAYEESPKVELCMA